MKNIILGTDWWTDCDDAVALRILLRYAKEKKINFLGIVINACMEYSLASVKGFLTAEGAEDIPLAIDLEATDFGGKPPYQKMLAEKFCPDSSNSDAEDAVRLYRKLLANAPEPVEIIEIGYLQAVTALFESGADDISDKSGLELVREKVSKIWVMAGKWDKDGEKENNFCRNERSRVAGKKFCELCPVEVTFLGWEIGFDVLTGGELAEDDLLHQILVAHGSGKGRCSWDPMLTLMALVGDEEKAGYDTVCGKATLDGETGANYFEVGENGPHKYVIKKHENDYYKNMINNIIKKSRRTKMSELQKNREYSVLFIGNSYTYFGDMPTETFEKVAKAAGYDVKVTSVTSGGYTLEAFADSADKHGARVDEAINGKKYDFVIMQEQSQRPASDPKKFINGLCALHNKVENAVGKAYLYATWGRKAGSEDLAEEGWTSRYMTDRLAASYTIGGEKIGAEVAYVGLAFADIYENHPDIDVYNPDRSHPSAIGSYLAGITLFAKIFGVDPRTIDFDASFDKNDTKIVKEAAYKAVFEEQTILSEQKEDILKILSEN